MDETKKQALEKLLAQGALQNDAFIREDYAHQRQKAFFVGGGLLILSTVLVFLTVTADTLMPRHVIGAFGPAMLAMGLARKWCRCPKCKKVPIHPATLIHQRSATFPSSCPRCGFVFDAKLIDDVSEEE